MPQSVVQRAFAGGELAPSLHARADLAKYQTGLRTCRNFMVLKEGGIANRGGTTFVAATKTGGATVQILPFVSEDDGESLLIEQGIGYLRFYQNGALLSVDLGTLDAWDNATTYAQGDVIASGGVGYYSKQSANTNHAPPNATWWHPLTGSTYEVPAPFTHRMNWEQSGCVITFTHKDEAPYELTPLGDGFWVLTPVSTVSATPAPTGVNVVPGGVGALQVGYVVTAIDATTGEESIASGQAIAASVSLATADAPHVVSWDPVTGADSYAVYKDPYVNGVYGYLGLADGATSFRDIGTEPDFALTPPLDQERFDEAGDYPHVSAHHQQRRIFGRTNDVPDGIWGSRTGYPSNFGISAPLQDDDAISFRIAGTNNHPIRHLTSLKAGLIVLTGAGEWTVTGGEGKALTPSDIGADQEGYSGAADVRPVAIGNAVVYVQARGRILRDMRFDQQVEGLDGRDLTIFAAHLFKGYTVGRIAYQQEPDSIVWCARSDGTLLGLTYLRDQDVWGWHRHDTGASGHVEDVAVVPEADEDALYLIVRRTIGGATVRYIERLRRRPVLAASFTAECIFLDASLSYSGTAVASLGGLGHLEGQTVGIVGDGVYRGTATVAAGAVALGGSYSAVHVGLLITAEFETLDLDVQGSALRDKKKRVNSVTLLLEDSDRSYQVGPDSGHLRANRLAPWDATARYTGPEEIATVAEWNDHGRVFVRHTTPLPLAVLGIVPSVDVGG